MKKVKRKGDIQSEYFRRVSCLYAVSLWLSCIPRNDAEVSPSNGQDRASILGIGIEGPLRRLRSGNHAFYRVNVRKKKETAILLRYIERPVKRPRNGAFKFVGRLLELALISKFSRPDSPSILPLPFRYRLDYVSALICNTSRQFSDSLMSLPAVCSSYSFYPSHPCSPRQWPRCDLTIALNGLCPATPSHPYLF